MKLVVTGPQEELWVDSFPPNLPLECVKLMFCLDFGYNPAIASLRTELEKVSEKSEILPLKRPSSYKISVRDDNSYSDDAIG